MKFLIVGIGNVGLRHIQGLANLSKHNIEFFMIDKNDDYKKRFNKEINKIGSKYIIKHINKIDQLKNINFELTILSTTATNRSKLLYNILEKISSKFILIEKPICQSINELEDLRKISVNNIFVNFPRRYCDWHKKIKNKLLQGKLNKIKSVKITGGYLGLACNACHFIDLLNSWTNKHPVSIDANGLGEWYVSKRDGFYEVEGDLKVFYEEDLSLEINSLTHKEGLKIELYDNKKQLILHLNNDEGFAKFSDGEIIYGRLKYQSENTHNLLKLLQNNDEEICNLNNAINSYNVLLKELINNWNQKFKTNKKKIKIT